MTHAEIAEKLKRLALFYADLQEGKAVDMPLEGLKDVAELYIQLVTQSDEPTENSVALVPPVKTRASAKDTPVKAAVPDLPEGPIVLYTDGACSGNPGPAGWGVVLRVGLHFEKTFKGHIPSGTNNIAEMQAVIEALRLLPERTKATLISDSEYVINGITKWVNGWKRKGWVNSQRKPVANKELWIEMDQLARNRQISWEWVRGHNGDDGNELADRLAVEGCRGTAHE